VTREDGVLLKQGPAGTAGGSDSGNISCAWVAATWVRWTWRRTTLACTAARNCCHSAALNTRDPSSCAPRTASPRSCCTRDEPPGRSASGSHDGETCHEGHGPTPSVPTPCACSSAGASATACLAARSSSAIATVRAPMRRLSSSRSASGMGGGRGVPQRRHPRAAIRAVVAVRAGAPGGAVAAAVAHAAAVVVGEALCRKVGWRQLSSRTCLGGRVVAEWRRRGRRPRARGWPGRRRESS